MKRSYGLLLALSMLLTLAPPAHAQLSGIWPRRFFDNQNRGLGGIAGPDTSLSLNHTYTVSNCSAPVVGSGPTIYVTSSGTFMSNACALYAFTINGSNQLVLSWTKVLTSVGGRFLSAPTLSSSYAYIAAGDISGGAGANLIRVELGGSHNATSVNITTSPQTAANVPPFLEDTSGNVYVCTESIASGGGAKVASYTSGLGLNWKYSILDNTGANADSLPFSGVRMVLKEGSPDYLYAHGYYLKYSMMGTYRHKALKVNASNGSVAMGDDLDTTCSSDGIPQSHPMLSGTSWYVTNVGASSPGSSGTVTFYLRSTGSPPSKGGNTQSLGSSTAGPTAAAIDANGDVWSLFGALREFNAALTSSVSYMYTGTAAPSISNDVMYFVDGNGDIRVLDISTTPPSLIATATASASDEVAVIDGTKLVAKEGSGLGLFTGT